MSCVVLQLRRRVSREAEWACGTGFVVGTGPASLTPERCTSHSLWFVTSGLCVCVCVGGVCVHGLSLNCQVILVSRRSSLFGGSCPRYLLVCLPISLKSSGLCYFPPLWWSMCLCRSQGMTVASIHSVDGRQYLIIIIHVSCLS